MATSTTESFSQDGHGCSICLDKFTSPRQLPCLHSFCEHCLQDYITAKAGSTDTIFEEFMCPVCRAVTRPANKERPVREWASLFPNSPFPLMGKSKVERSCEVCSNSSDTSSILAKKLCVVCEEFMCDNYAMCHKNMKITKSHQIIGIEQLESNPQTRFKFLEGFGCPEHDNEDIKFYCRSHETACCGTCFFLHHKACSNVLQLKESLPSLLKEINANKLIEEMQKFEDHLNNFMEMNEETIGKTESHVNSISLEIGDIRKKLNTLLDDIEKMVKLEGNRIYKEWLIRKQEQNHQCQSLLNAIRNSQALVETVVHFGSDTQIFLVTRKTMKQLKYYSDQIREKFERVDNIRISLELDSNMKAVLMKDALGLVKIECQQETKDLQCTNLMIPLKKQTVELSRAIDIQCPNLKYPLYYGIVQLPDGYTILADYNNKTCCLFDSSHNFITSYNLPGNPYGMCLIGDNEVAVTIPNMKTVQFLTISDGSITETGMVAAKYRTQGVDSLTREEIIVSGHCGNAPISTKCYWSLITRNGNVKIHHEFDCKRTLCAHVAVDASKSRVYISVTNANAVYCFGLIDGKQYFIYSSKDLVHPWGIALDREYNVFIVGSQSNNIHKLSPSGVTLEIITCGVLENPKGISFNHSKDNFVITSEKGTTRKLHYFLLK
ncbi:hypothetical protein ACJMK2_004079 [Sinanodonta woodiana]|uniref:Uncharacterized protein n=1 Tax=Sinanodonta woodiana TaxID=1069815 RepID=A0ABD3Y2Y4_SINWO